jgi:DNA-directed RNA polymerase specialized sigma24 family protein
MAKWTLKTDIPLFYPDRKLPNYTTEELNELVNRYLIDPSYQNDVVESQMRLTLTIASMYLSKYKHDQEELVSDALFSLVKAVNRFRLAAATDPDGSNIQAFINRTIWLDLKKAVLKQHLIPIPSTVLHQKLRDGTLQQADVVSILGDEEVYRQHNHENETDTLDLVNVVIKCDEQRKVLRMRVAKYEGQEIADELKVKVTYVWNTCRQIREKLSLYLGG